MTRVIAPPADLTPGQVRAALDALGLDYDHTVYVALSPGRVFVTTAQVDADGYPIMEGGVLLTTDTTITVQEAS